MLYLASYSNMATTKPIQTAASALVTVSQTSEMYRTWAGLLAQPLHATRSSPPGPSLLTLTTSDGSLIPSGPSRGQGRLGLGGLSGQTTSQLLFTFPHIFPC